MGDVALNEGIEEGIEGRRLGVDKNLGFGPRGIDEPGGRIDPKARPGHDEDVAFLEDLLGVRESLVVELLPIEDNVRSHDATALWAARNAAMGNFIERISASAGKAVVAKNRAMEFHHVFRTGLLVEAVDVLGNDPDGSFVRSDGPVSGIGLGLVMDEEVPIEIEEGGGILVQLVDRKEPFVGETVPAGHPADARLAPKVGNSRSRRHPSPIQEGQ